jgi:WD40 repeat protein
VSEAKPFIALWDVAASKEVGRLKGKKELFSCLAFSPDGTLLASSGHDHATGPPK